MGNISLKEGEPFVHANATLADSDSNTRGGHSLEGKVFAAEVHVTELIGIEIIRKNDAATGLWLWNL